MIQFIQNISLLLLLSSPSSYIFPTHNIPQMLLKPPQINLPQFLRNNTKIINTPNISIIDILDKRVADGCSVLPVLGVEVEVGCVGGVGLGFWVVFLAV